MTAAATASNGGGGGGRVAAWIGSLGGRSGGSFNGSLSRAASGVSERSRSESGKPPRGELAAAFDGAAAFFRRNNLPLLFLVAMAVALAAPAPGRAVLKPQVKGVHVVQFFNMCAVFFISGLTLRTAEVKSLLRGRTLLALVYGTASIMLLTPVAAFVVRALPLQPREYAAGLAIFATVPTTLGVGVSLVRSARGNAALAILLTTLTNVAGVAAIPLWLRGVLGGSGGGGAGGAVRVDFVPVFVKLLLSCLAPTLLGKAARELLPPARRLAEAHGAALSVFSNFNLAFIIWQTLSAAQAVIVGTPTGATLVVIAATGLLHAAYLLINAAAAALLRLPPKEAACVVLMASQKSAPVAVNVITFVAASAAAQGALAVPCVVGQLLQIFCDQPIANYLGARIARAEKAAAAAAEAEKAAVLPVTVAAAAAAGGGKGGEGGEGAGTQQASNAAAVV